MILTVTLNPAIDKRLVVPSFLYGQVMRVTECNYTAGGKGLNVARVAAIAGERVVATGFIAGHAGAYVEEQLHLSGVESRFLSVPGETRSCVNLYDASTGKSTELLEPGIPITEEYIEAFVALFQELATEADVITISGSAPKGAPFSIYFRLINIAHSLQKPVLLDTSGALLKESIEAKPTMIKPNSDEIQSLTDLACTENRQSLILTAKNLHQRGIPLVVVSLGKGGALLVCDQGVFQGITPNIPVVNTVGCGDSLVAAFAVGIQRRQPIQETFRQAMAISTANALCMETGFFRQEDFLRLLEQVKVELLEDPPAP